MKSTYFFRQLIDDETYIENLDQFADQPTDSTKRVYQIAVSLMLACLHIQLQTSIGRGLVQRILEKHAHQAKAIPAGFTASVTEGNRLLGTLLPGKKSVIMKIIIHYTKLPFKNIDSIVGQCAYTLFTKLAFDLLRDDDATILMLPLSELEELAPELNTNDYVAIGAYSVASLSRPVSISTLVS